MPRKRQVVKERRDWSKLSVEQHWQLITVEAPLDAFESVDDFREAWRRHRDQTMGTFLRKWGQDALKRPQSWWKFEVGLDKVPSIKQQQALLLGLNGMSDGDKILACREQLGVEV